MAVPKAVKDRLITARTALPYNIPIVDVKCVPVPREFFGIGVPEVLEDDQEYIDILRSQRLDNLDLILNKMFKVRIGSDTDPDMIYSAPGGIIPVSIWMTLMSF